MRRLDRLWRLVGTGLSFALFGLGGLFIGLTVFPALHLLTRRREVAQRRCQAVIHHCFRLFLGFMRGTGVLTYAIDGADRLRGRHGLLVVANHPSLIDVVLIGAHLPRCLCVVKHSHWRNPFMMGVMRATGYIPNDDPIHFIENCVAAIHAGRSLVIFPEGTRTTPNQPPQLKRGAASIIASSVKPFTPVVISCEPTTLTKNEKWYRIPHSRPHFQLTVLPDVDPAPLLPPGEALSRSNRRINRLLQSLLCNGHPAHGDSSPHASFAG